MKRNGKKLLVSLAAPFLAGAIGGLVTYPSITTWYAALAKPSFNPPNWVFGPVWTLLYISMAISLYIVWTTKLRGGKQAQTLKKAAFAVFGAQLVLNVLWSVVFFGFHALVLAAVVIALLWGMIGLNIVLFFLVSRKAAYLLVPYLLWVSFAAVLNISVADLNASKVESYDQCIRSAGSVVLDLYPSVCVTKDKRSFVNPHEARQQMRMGQRTAFIDGNR